MAQVKGDGASARPLALCSDHRPGPSVHKTFTSFDTEMERSSGGALLVFQDCRACHQGGRLNVTIILGRRFEWIIQFFSFIKLNEMFKQSTSPYGRSRLSQMTSVHPHRPHLSISLSLTPSNNPQPDCQCRLGDGAGPAR